jgi:WD40 repeat protein
MQVYDVVTAALVPGCKFQGHHGVVYDVTWSPDSHIVASASSDCTVKLWHVPRAAAAAATSAAARCCAGAPSATALLDTNIALAYTCTIKKHGAIAYACAFQPTYAAASLGDIDANAAASAAHSECHPVLAIGLEGGRVSLWQVFTYAQDAQGRYEALVPTQLATQCLPGRAIAAHLGSLDAAGAITALVWDVHADRNDGSRTGSAEADSLLSGARHQK